MIKLIKYYRINQIRTYIAGGKYYRAHQMCQKYNKKGNNRFLTYLGNTIEELIHLDKLMMGYWNTTNLDQRFKFVLDSPYINKIHKKSRNLYSKLHREVDNIVC